MNSYDKTFRQRTAERAVRRYASSLKYGANARRRDGNTEEQAANYSRAVERAGLRTMQIRQVLMAHGILPMHFMTYGNFGLHVDKLIREHEGESLRQLVLAAIDRWTRDGLRPDVLREICRTVFRLSMDVPPPVI